MRYHAVAEWLAVRWTDVAAPNPATDNDQPRHAEKRADHAGHQVHIGPKIDPQGKPLDPTKFNARFDARIAAADVRRITVLGTRGTCAILLAALDVHPRVPCGSCGTATSR